MKLYYTPGVCSLADHIALIESGLPFEKESVDLRTKTTATGIDFHGINPKGYVPALELENGEVLTENIAILSYIAETSGRLIPKSGMERFRALEVAAFTATELHKNFKPFFDPASTSDDKHKGGEILSSRLSVMERQLADRQYIVGSTLSVADCYLFVMLMWMNRLGLALSPKLAAYYSRLRELPSFAKALKDEGLHKP